MLNRPETDAGLAQAEAARGPLIHRVRLNPDGTVLRYQILAPRQLIFFQKGTLKRALPGLAAGDLPSLRKQVELLVQAMHPCVAFEVAIHA